MNNMMGGFSGDMDRNEVEIDLNKFMSLLQEKSELIPRAFLSVYMYLLYYVVFWYMDLTDPSMEQSGLISVVVGAGAAWFGLYTSTSKSGKDFSKK